MALWMSAISVVDESQVPLTLLWVIVNFHGCSKCSFLVRGWWKERWHVLPSRSMGPRNPVCGPLGNGLPTLPFMSRARLCHDSLPPPQSLAAWIVFLFFKYLRLVSSLNFCNYCSHGLECSSPQIFQGPLGLRSDILPTEAFPSSLWKGTRRSL